MSKKLTLAVILCFSVFVLFYIFISIFTSEQSNALEISESCSLSDRQYCLTEKILSETRKHPESSARLFRDFAYLLKTHYFQDDPRIFSPIVHLVGMDLFTQGTDPLRAFRYCGENFKQGCLHGYIMEYLEHMPHENDPSIMLKVCNFSKNNESHYANCIHAVGHEFSATTPGSILLALQKCKKAPLNVFSACTSGVFMEFSTGIHGTGGHSHLPTGSIELPCSKLPVEFMPTCYISTGAYRQYTPDKETFSESATFCASIPEKYQGHCMLGLAEKIYTAAAEDIHASKKICTTFPSDVAQSCEVSLDRIKEIESVL